MEAVVDKIVLYRIVWRRCPPDMVWYEPSDHLGLELLREFELLKESDAKLIDLKESDYSS
eukprot:6205718-Pleurochrysis_carterae.AAC.16